MRLLIVEDSRRLRQSLEEGLRRLNYAVDTTADGNEAYTLARTDRYDLIILDLMLPGMPGLEVLQKLRHNGNDVHILILTARDAIEHRVEGLRAGADDYLVKPFAFDELAARIDVLVRRRHGQKSSSIVIGSLEMDLSARTVQRGGKPIELTAREFALLEYLALRKGQVVSRMEIENHIYDGRVDPASNVVDSAICILRRKIDCSDRKPRTSIIQTRRNLGYVLEDSDNR